MSTIKLNKLVPTLEKYKGTQQTLLISVKDLEVAVSGEIHRVDDQFCFTKGTGKVVLSEEKAGSLFSWRGTYKTYHIRFMVGQETLAEFIIPEYAKLSFIDPEAAAAAE
jgi:hypothetical protein